VIVVNFLQVVFGRLKTKNNKRTKGKILSLGKFMLLFGDCSRDRGTTRIEESKHVPWFQRIFTGHQNILAVKSLENKYDVIIASAFTGHQNILA
jgi:hypothetical protein